MTQIDSSEVLKKWQSGVEFSFAWHKFADAHALRKFREATTLGNEKAHQILMVADLWAGLRAGEFQAFGKCVAPKISSGPILIPEHTFEFEPPRGIEDSNDFKISGWRYESVKVIRVRESDANAATAQDFKPELEATRQPVVDGVAIEPVAPLARKRGSGRPDTYQYSKSVLRALYAIPSNLELSAEKLYPAFEVEFQNEFPRDRYQIDAPKDRTLRKQIERYRQELAKTGKN